MAAHYNSDLRFITEGIPRGPFVKRPEQNKYSKPLMSMARAVKNGSCVISGFRREVAENCALLRIRQQVVVIPYRRFGKKRVFLKMEVVERHMVGLNVLS